nr:MAG TPA: hypothetical protein [Caudoviricetes sp.]
MACSILPSGFLGTTTTSQSFRFACIEKEMALSPSLIRFFY